MRPSAELADKVRRRAEDRCEYRKMHQSLQGAAFHIEHVIPESKGGVNDLSNLALACPSCNLHKSDRTKVPDSESGNEQPLFNPRADVWAEHFEWRGYEMKGLNAIGRATIQALRLNDPRRLRIREAEAQFGMFAG